MGPIRNYFTLNGMPSTDYGVIISKAGVFGAPQRSYEAVSVPGKNGDLLFDNKRYENVIGKYEGSLINSKSDIDAFRAWLLSHTSYTRLEDTYHPDEYRMAMPTGGFDPEMLVNNKIGQFQILFNCKPQRFLKSGEIPVALTSSGAIHNPTLYTARPLIRVYGYGSLGIGSETVTIASHSLPYIDLDCDIEDAYCGATNANRYITLSGKNYPGINSGVVSISLSANISSVVITPRWWMI